MKIGSLLGCTFLILNASGQVVAPTPVPDNSQAIPIVLTNYYTTPASRFDQITQYPFRDVPRGRQTLGNVPLDIGGMICLWGSWNTKSGFPEQVTGIKVGRKFDALYLYHIVFSRSPDGTPISELVFRYGNGTSFTNTICYGTHVRDWFEKKGEPATPNDPNSEIVWRGTNTSSRSIPPSMLQFFMTEFANPKPSLEVVSIDVYSLKTKTSPCMMAMTTGPAHLLRIEGAQDKPKK